MSYLETGGNRVTIPAGELRIGSDPAGQLVLAGAPPPGGDARRQGEAARPRAPPARAGGAATRGNWRRLGGPTPARRPHPGGGGPAQGVADGARDRGAARQFRGEAPDDLQLGGGEDPAAVDSAGRLLAGQVAGHGGRPWPAAGPPGRVMFQGSRASSACPAGGLPPAFAQASTWVPQN